MEFLSDDLCNRCLIQPNVTVRFLAITAKGSLPMPPEYNPTDPKSIGNWYDAIMAREGGNIIRFDYGPMTNVLMPISTWKGDPVCAWHLRVLVERETRLRLA